MTRTLHEHDAEAIVYDLDGTLIDLIVDWDVVAGDVAARLAEADVDATGVDLWRLIDLAAEVGLSDEVEAIIAGHEHDGAHASERLPLADELVEGDGPIGVCSLNCEEACRIALETHGLLDDVDAVVGRDTVATRKPDPEPLLEVARRLSVDPSEILFIGDSERDEEAAENAGTDFLYVRTLVAECER